jgi:hypothetical protein
MQSRRFEMPVGNVSTNLTISKDIGSDWLTNGHLETCILKLHPPTSEQWSVDKSRIENISIVSQLLQPVKVTLQSPLAQEFPNKPVLVLAPELAFGSPDFESLDSLVKQYSQDLILICGFGFTSGGTVIALAAKNDVAGAWTVPPNANKKYNGGWVWVKNDGKIRCYIFLKNYLEQNDEITVENITTGDCILRLDGKDVVIFPLICADLICKEANSPSDRIQKSLSENSPSNRKVLVTGSLLNKKSDCDHWKTSIGDLLYASKASNVRLLLCNCVNPTPVKNEATDKWRCLSGVFQYRENCKPPRKPLPCIRYVDGEKFSGLVLRNSEVGVVYGKLQWTNNPSEGKNAFSECSQQIWNVNEFQICDGRCAADELYRFIMRNKGSILHNNIPSNDITKELANRELEKLLTELSPASNSPIRSVAGDLFQKCLMGIKQEALFSPDQLYSRSENLDRAITTLKLIQHAVLAELMPVGKELGYGQLLSGNEEHEILVWDTCEHSAKDLYDLAMEEVVVESGSARPLTIICRGNNTGMPPPDGRIKSSRSADFTNAPPNTSNDKDIREHGDRVVFWKNQGQIDEIFKSTDPRQDLVESIQQEITVPEDS